DRPPVNDDAGLRRRSRRSFAAMSVGTHASKRDVAFDGLVRVERLVPDERLDAPYQLGSDRGDRVRSTAEVIRQECKEGGQGGIGLVVPRRSKNHVSAMDLV